MRHRIIAVIEQLPSLDDLNRFVDVLEMCSTDNSYRSVDVLEIRDMLFGTIVENRKKNTDKIAIQSFTVPRAR